MPAIREGQTIAQRDPLLKVTSRLKAGRHLFRLVVVDEAGNPSDPAELVVTVRPPGPDRPDRPERPERPGRPNRPGRPIRPGRGGILDPNGRGRPQ